MSPSTTFDVALPLHLVPLLRVRFDMLQRPPHLDESVYKKIKNDDCEIELKNAFLSFCRGSKCETRSDETQNTRNRSVESAYDEFVKDHQGTGVPMALDDGEILGRITNLYGVARYVAKSLKQDVDDVQQFFLWLSELSKPGPTPNQLRAAEDWFDDLRKAVDPNTGSAIVISPPVCWVFRSELGNKDANDDLIGDLNCLPCRLGLPDLLNPDEKYETGLDYLCLTIAAKNAKNARRANFCHGGYMNVRDIWEPGGRTVPIPYGPNSCKDKGGLLEIICDAVAYKHVLDPIRVART